MLQILEIGSFIFFFFFQTKPYQNQYPAISVSDHHPTDSGNRGGARITRAS